MGSRYRRYDSRSGGGDISGRSLILLIFILSVIGMIIGAFVGFLDDDGDKTVFYISAPIAALTGLTLLFLYLD